MRAIVRFSVDGENDTPLRNQLRAVFMSAGFVLNQNVTGTYEHPMISGHQLAQTMLHFWQMAMHAPNAAHIEHIWIYCDNPPDYLLALEEASET